MKKTYLSIILFFFVSNLWAQSPSLIKNVNPTTTDVFSGSFPKKGIALNGLFYLPATNYNGSELWKTDGTAAGTALIKDIASIFDRQDANLRLFNAIGDSLYFFGQEGFHLYKYVPATGKLSEAPYGKAEAWSPTEAVAIGNNIFFASDDYFGQGVELLRYNTVTGFISSYNINPDTFSSYPHNLTALGDSLFFAATDTANGTELWMYDPNIDDITLVQDIAPGHDSSNPADLVAYNNKLFFTATDATNGYELWVSDGSSSGTYLYNDINTSGDSNPAHKKVFGTRMFFSADDGSSGNELWMVDDFNTNTQMVADINAFGDSNPGIHGFIGIDSLLYFAADDGNDGIELWVMDTINLSPAEVVDISPCGNSDPMDMYQLGDTLIFVANDCSGWQIWRSNGTSATTSVIQNVQPSFSDTVHIAGILDNMVYFGANDGTHGVELWKTGGTAATTSMVKDINLGSGISSDPQWFEPFNGAMFFNARTNQDYYFSLYKTDATSGGTVEVRRGSIDSNFTIGPNHPVVLGSNLILSAFTDSTGFELWKSDGTWSGTLRVMSIRPGPTGSDPANFIILGSNAYFTANDSTHGQELWKTDGTSAGTSMVKDIRTGLTGSDISDLRVANGKLFFTANDSLHGREVWVSDGTASGTFMLQDIWTGTTGSSPGSLYATSNLLYFTADDSVHGAEVWTSDGTTAGTSMVKDINVGTASSQAGWFAKLGTWVYFVATDSVNVSTKLWRTDGTAANTALFFNVNYPFLLYNVGSKIVFICDPVTSTNGFHMWSTDGTTGGTGEIADFLPGECGYFLLDNFTVYNNHVFYWLDDNISGQELWGSDGTVSGTIKYDIATGPASSYPRNANGFNPLIFSADDGSTNGREPWMLNVTATPLPVSSIDLDAAAAGADVALEWKNMSMNEPLAFQVQRSKDGWSFDGIGLLRPEGPINGTVFHFKDTQPLDGVNYYRIKRLEENGKYVYSNTRAVTMNRPSQVNAYPNPAHDVLNINVSHIFTNGMLTVTTIGGQLALQRPITGPAPVTIPTKDLAPGLYKAELSDGTYVTRLLFIKQ